MADWLPYERGAIVSDTRDDHAKLREAWRVVRARRDAGLPVVNLTGLERSLDPADVEPGPLDDELAPALLGERFRELALEHLGGDPVEDEAFLANRTTAGLLATIQTLVPDGGVVVGVSAGYSHPAVVRSVLLARGRFVDSVGADGFAAALATAPRVDVVVVTRLAVTYEALAADELSAIVATARDREVVVVADDAGGARVGPACLGQPRTLALGVDVGVTGLDKYGVTGPRLGLVAGRADLVHAIRARAIELGLEARPMLLPAALGSLERYRPERVRELVTTTQELGEALERQLGSVVTRTPFALKVRGESIRAPRAPRESPRSRRPQWSRCSCSATTAFSRSTSRPSLPGRPTCCPSSSRRRRSRRSGVPRRSQRRLHRPSSGPSRRSARPTPCARSSTAAQPATSTDQQSRRLPAFPTLRPAPGPNGFTTVRGSEMLATDDGADTPSRGRCRSPMSSGPRSRGPHANRDT
jgi:L-seryl-tRNA(Ser) seleniumtransferase